MNTDNGNNLLPTSTCFDDTMEILNLLARKFNFKKHKNTFYIVHGLVKPTDIVIDYCFPHAWVEFKGEIYEMFIYKGEKVLTVRPQYEAPNVKSKIIKQWRYDVTYIEQLIEENNNVTTGPWEPELVELQNSLEQVKNRLQGTKNV